MSPRPAHRIFDASEFAQFASNLSPKGFVSQEPNVLAGLAAARIGGIGQDVRGHLVGKRDLSGQRIVSRTVVGSLPLIAPRRVGHNRAEAHSVLLDGKARVAHESHPRQNLMSKLLLPLCLE